MDCIRILAGIFGVKKELDSLKAQHDIFDGNGSGWDYVEYIRSLCIIHPLGTARHPNFNGYRNWKIQEKIIKQPTEFVEYSEYIREIEKEYSVRGYYNQENNFEYFIRIFNT